MDANGIIGREYEQKLILERCKSNKAELIAIYGRRRVGKTFLVRKIFNDQFACVVCRRRCDSKRSCARSRIISIVQLHTRSRDLAFPVEGAQ